ncbi:MAG TPA: NADH-quinone oxidoreductase subunit J [Mycobacterium sp.]|jgi:NADH-quinone oxidoreductase subunit J|nr:NADH-quinone oxidoreductase subunit J [Mycobacterium sp.]
MTTHLASEAMGRTSAGEATLFWVLAAAAVLGAVGVVSAGKAVHSAIWLAATMIALAVLYIAQGALFLGVVQVVVYTGAVMMLFLFVLMVIGVDSSESLVETIRGQRIAAITVGVGFGIVLSAGIGNVSIAGFAGDSPAEAGDSAHALANLIFTRYVWAFELTSALLITAAMGAMVFAHRRRSALRRTQRQLAVERFRPGGQPTTLPNPGVFAHHNAVNVAALLPDGTPALRSVSGVLRPHIIGTARNAKPTTARSHLQLVTPLPDVGADWVDDWVDAAQNKDS